MKIAALSDVGLLLDPERYPVAVILTPEDKVHIAEMLPGDTVYACFSAAATDDQKVRIRMWIADLKRKHSA